MRRTRSSLLLAILSLSLFLIPTGGHVVSAAEATFQFAAAGDHNQSTTTNSSLRRLAASGVNFYLALGDLSYTSVGEESEWCDVVKSYVGQNFPFELVSGFHDDGRESPPNDGGLIDSYANCLPDKMGSTGVYGKEYYFDYPPSSPLARIILVSPALNFTNGGYYSYRDGSSGIYSKGRGTIFVITGTFGQIFYPINFTNPNVAYFTSLASNNTRGMGHGFVQISVAASELKAQTDFSGSFSDSFTIVKPGALQSTLFFLQDNLIFVVLSIAPILAGITVISLKRWRRSPLLTKD